MSNIIETARLILRPWQANDLEELEQLFADPAVRKGRHLPPERIRVIAQSSLQQWQRNGFGPWAALDKATGQWIGRVGLDELDDWPDADKIEIGWELRREWWDKGLACANRLGNEARTDCAICPIGAYRKPVYFVNALS